VGKEYKRLKNSEKKGQETRGIKEEKRKEKRE